MPNTLTGYTINQWAKAFDDILGGTEDFRSIFLVYEDLGIDRCKELADMIRAYHSFYRVQQIVGAFESANS